MATPKLEVAFGVSATVEPAAGDWVDLSSRLRSFDVPRGRQKELDQHEAGTGTFVLENLDRALDADNVQSPYYPNVRPNAHVRFTEDDEAAAVFRGYADRWPQSWPSSRDSIVTLVATDAFKILANIDLPASVWELEIRDASPKAWWRLGEPALSTEVRDSIGDHVGIVVGNPEIGVEGLLEKFDPDTAIEFTGDGATYIALPPEAAITTADFTLEVSIKTAETSGGVGRLIYDQTPSDFLGYTYMHVDVGGGAGNVRWVQEPIGGSFTILSTSGVNVADDRKHQVAFRRSTADNTVKIHVDGIERASAAETDNGGYAATTALIGNLKSGVGPSSSALFGGIIDDLVIFESAISAATILEHYNHGAKPFSGKTSGEAITRILDYIDWPASLRDIDTGQSELQAHALGGKALAYFQRLAQTEEGFLYVEADGKLTFRERDYLQTTANESLLTFGDDPDNPNEIPYVDLVLEPADESTVINGARVGRSGGTVFTVEDATSAALYFSRTIERTDLLHATDLETIDHGNHYVHRFKDPKSQVRSLSVMLADPRVPADQILDLTFGDLVTVVRRPKGRDGLPEGLPIEKTVRVEGITHSGTKDPVTWKVEFWFSGWDADTDQYWIVGDPVYSVVGSTTRVGF